MPETERQMPSSAQYLCYALYNATKYVCLWDPTFAAYLAKKRAEGKHYNVALSHAAKKLVRLIYALEKSHQSYNTAAYDGAGYPILCRNRHHF